ncbi:GNAT family N-acetyltransferase [Flavobacterium sp. ASW18X]|uniref:GNAT family N-acetyltransferase n=1 Tax=Flavobacterium sp. ASW18X TaxID=2572595 RepID=UPI0010AE1008|nr:GNAT family N-acetyltransferase [Flavobacterium sp. ASW18X]TKD65333.1 GNAT family N-acetyltransferase [Flavobacterium sp. ASW18X]
MVHYTKVSSDEELHQILALQQLNLAKNLVPEEVIHQGFVTVEHDFDILRLLNKKHPHTIAKDKNMVVGYALSMHPTFKDTIPILKPMFAEIEKLKIPVNFMAMGQICIAKSHRGQGLFRGLYKAMKHYLPETIESIITEVDCTNKRSMQAHQTIGFKELLRYSADGKKWSLIMLK